jgi:hypothetical protein
LRGGGCGEKFRSKPFPIYPNRDARAPPGFERRAASPLRVPERRRRAGREKYKAPSARAEERRPRAAKLMGRVSQQQLAPRAPLKYLLARDAVALANSRTRRCVETCLLRAAFIGCFPAQR